MLHSSKEATALDNHALAVIYDHKSFATFAAEFSNVIRVRSLPLQLTT
jgi:hypothetical protein